MADSEKRYVLFAGVNGVGKSTLYYLHPELQNGFRINLDEIAKKIGSWRNPAVVMEAGRKAIKLRSQYMSQGISFNQETTLCGHDAIKNIKRARSLGYIIEMHYVGVSSVEICKERIKIRVAEGGHGVEDSVVERRYNNSFDNLKEVMPLCNKIYFYDNTKEFRLFAIYNNGSMQYASENLPDWYRKYIIGT